MSKKSLRLAFAGTPEIAKIVLEALVNANQHEIAYVLTQPDRPAGRGRGLRQSEVKQYAIEAGLTVYQPANAIDINPAILRDVDLVLVIAYGLLIREEMINIPPLGFINIHTSLLPRWRGAAPIQRAIEAGDKKTGITIMQMEAGLDTGPILHQIECPIPANITGGELHDELARISAKSINKVLCLIAEQKITGTQQNNELACYAGKISKEEAALDWEKTAHSLEQKIRAFNPFPIAHTILNGIQMRIWEAQVTDADNTDLKPGKIINSKNNLEVQTAKGILQIDKLQLPGKKIITAKDFLNGYPNFNS